MANTVLSTNMILPIPVVGIDPGPDWANNINNCLTIIDQHNHAIGSGVQINPDGININSDLAFNNSNLTLARSLRLNPQVAPLALVGDLGCLYESGVDLYFNDGNGTQIRITQSGAVAGTPGSIANLVSPASASYVSANSTFVFQSDVNTPGNVDGGFFILRNNVASSKGLTLQPPSAMAANYSITLPSLPGSNLPVSISSGGIMSAAQITFAQLDASTQSKITGTAPTIQKFLSGSGTYTTPVSPAPLYIKITMVGGGGGGATANQAGAGSDGTDTTFGTSLLLAGKGFGAIVPTGGGAGGSASLGTGPIGIALSGAAGSTGNSFGNSAGSPGASSPLGGAGQGAPSTGGAAVPNTGSGGGGGGGSAVAGGGGGAGGYVSAMITSSIASTYAYTVGIGGAGGVGGGEPAGGAGASGIIIVEEYYQ